MTATELIETWDKDHISKFDGTVLQRRGVDSETIEILSIVGLPEDAAPFLIFGGIHNGESIAEIYGTGKHSEQFLIEIGTDGSGDPICIDVRNKSQIVVCDHEDGFQKRYMNSSVTILLRFITLYRDFVEKLIRTKGEKAFLDANFTDEELDDLLRQFTRVDKNALDEGTYWSREIQTLKANREFYQSDGHRR